MGHIAPPLHPRTEAAGLQYRPRSCIYNPAADLGPPQAYPEECSSMARAPVSKTGGWGFESLHSCQA